VPQYEIVVRGDPDVKIKLADLAAESGLSCTAVDRGTRLTGELFDRAALHGLLDRLFVLGLDLLAVERRSSRHAP
jgi:hypothetical protein